MDFDVDDLTIRKTVMGRNDSYRVKEDWYTPSGNRRTNPVYITTVRNSYLDKSREIKAQVEVELHQKAREQIEKWKEQEIRAKLSHAKQMADSEAEAYWADQVLAAQDVIEQIRALLSSSLKSSPVLDLNLYFDRTEFPQFTAPRPRPSAPQQLPPPLEPKRTLLRFIIPPLWRRQLDLHSIAVDRYSAENHARQLEYENDVARWEGECQAALKVYEVKKNDFLRTQSEHNQHIKYFIEQYEAGEYGAVKGYLEEVFFNVKYPDAFTVKHEVSFDPDSSTAVIDITLPPQDIVPTTVDYKFKKTTRSADPVEMKPKEHEDLYDSAIKQSVLRTLHTVIAATRSDSVSGAVVNGWVTYLDKATGTDKTSCVISVSTDRQKFEEVNLSRVDPTECIKALKGIVAGPLSQVVPVQPILQLNREDKRFIESQAVLAEINATTNLAEIGWEEFEHLVRELFGKMFSEQGAEVKVTQASSDGGVDAIAFDPDPIRGGKFVIQAKRYTKAVPVSAVRDLYGTMISEGASKGLLVTTAHYGRDSREFVKDKPISLIDGSNLVYLLENYGHKVRIDINEARNNKGRNPLAR